MTHLCMWSRTKDSNNWILELKVRVKTVNKSIALVNRAYKFLLKIGSQQNFNLTTSWQNLDPRWHSNHATRKGTKTEYTEGHDKNQYMYKSQGWWVIFLQTSAHFPQPGLSTSHYLATFLLPNHYFSDHSLNLLFC